MTYNLIPTQYSPNAAPAWHERITRPVAALTVAVVLGAGGVGVLGYRLHDTQQHLSASRSQVRSLVSERDGLQNDLAESDADLEQARKDLKSTKDDLASTKVELSQAQTNLAGARQRGSALSTNRQQLLQCLTAVLNAGTAAAKGDNYTAALLLRENDTLCRSAIDGVDVPGGASDDTSGV